MLILCFSTVNVFDNYKMKTASFETSAAVNLRFRSTVVLRAVGW
jgi:hypothetical protein